MYGVWCEYFDMSGEFVYHSNTRPMLFADRGEAAFVAGEHNRRRLGGAKAGYVFSVRELPAELERPALLAELSEYTATCDNIALAELIAGARQAVRRAEARRAQTAGQARRE